MEMVNAFKITYVAVREKNFQSKIIANSANLKKVKISQSRLAYFNVLEDHKKYFKKNC